MDNRRDFGPTPQDGAPTMAAPAAGQQQGAWPQQAPYGGPGSYPQYGQQPPDVYYDQQPPDYGQQVPAPAPPPSAPPPSQSVIVQQPVPAQAPRQQAPAPRVAPANHSVVRPAPVSPNSPVPEPNPNPEQQQQPKQDAEPQQKQDPEPRQKQDPLPEQKQDAPPEASRTCRISIRAIRRTQRRKTPTPRSAPENLLCHPNPPGCTGDQKAPAQPAP